MDIEPDKTSHQVENSKVNADYSDFGKIGHFIWDMFSIGNHLHDIRQTWAKKMGVTGPQWLILFAISSLDEGNGVAVGRVAEKLHVKSTFVTTQTRLLEKSGFIKRVTSSSDKRVVLMSLTQSAELQMSEFEQKRTAVHQRIFGDLSKAEFEFLVTTIAKIESSASNAKTTLLAQVILQDSVD